MGDCQESDLEEPAMSPAEPQRFSIQEQDMLYRIIGARRPAQDPI